ncbi:MAG: hypothetical protein ABIP38_02120 [Steroidobacteraceae bacterium]
MLHGKYAEQRCVDEDGGEWFAGNAGVDRLRHPELFDEADGVDESSQEER